LLVWGATTTTHLSIPSGKSPSNAHPDILKIKVLISLSIHQSPFLVISLPVEPTAANK